MAYLDYNATAPLRHEVRELMASLAEKPLNASSAHSFGRQAKKILEDSRKSIAGYVSAFPREIIFTASATEANNWALRAFPDRRVLAASSEHSSVLASAADTLSVDSNGIVDTAALDAQLAQGEPALVSVMLANNETGVIQPVAEIASICKKHNALLHTDAVQALGKVPVEFSADLMTIAAHKCGGPVGAAALVVRGELPIAPMIRGGGQELNRRAGTENLASIAGFAKALELAGPLTELRNWLDEMEQVLAPHAVVFGKDAPRLPTTSCIAMPGVGNEVQLMHFDLKGFAVSAGSACSSGRIEPSHVLRAMGISQALAASAIRVSGGWATTQAEIRAFTQEWLAFWEQVGHRIRLPA